MHVFPNNCKEALLLEDTHLVRAMGMHRDTKYKVITFLGVYQAALTRKRTETCLNSETHTICINLSILIYQCEVVRSNERKIGLTFHEVSCTEGDSNPKKIVIDSIDPESPVDYSSLKEGDIILEINGMPVVDAKQVSKLIRGSSRR